MMLIRNITFVAILTTLTYGGETKEPTDGVILNVMVLGKKAIALSSTADTQHHKSITIILNTEEKEGFILKLDQQDNMNFTTPGELFNRRKVRNETIEDEENCYYTGRIDSDNDSLAAVSVCKNEVRGIIREGKVWHSVEPYNTEVENKTTGNGNKSWAKHYVVRNINNELPAVYSELRTSSARYADRQKRHEVALYLNDTQNFTVEKMYNLRITVNELYKIYSSFNINISEVKIKNSTSIVERNPKNGTVFSKLMLFSEQNKTVEACFNKTWEFTTVQDSSNTLELLTSMTRAFGRSLNLMSLPVCKEIITTTTTTTTTTTKLPPTTSTRKIQLWKRNTRCCLSNYRRR